MGIASRSMGLGLRLLNRFGGSALVERAGLRKPGEKLIGAGSRAGFLAAGAAARAFAAVKSASGAQRPGARPRAALFDLNLSEEQEMLRNAASDFAREALRPAALAADADQGVPAELRASFNALGVQQMGIPESLGGVGNERSSLDSLIVTEALAHGDLGMALACLAPSAVSQALVLWGGADLQATYLPAFAGEQVPVAALAVQEPHALFDPFRLRACARHTPWGYVLEGEKALVPGAAQAELFVIAAHVEGRGPALFLIEAATAGVEVCAEPAMGLRAAATGRLRLRQVKVPAANLLGDGRAAVYADCVQLARLAWSGLAVGAAQAALDYLVPYVNERVAFGEPISHRQSVAFGIANMGIELEGMRLLAWRAASRADQGMAFHEQAALARLQCAEHGMRIASDAVQFLGGHGFVKEHPAERWYRDLRALGFMEGAVLV